ncbi:unnamed protein product, partial [Phaeothamnion confervicola]
MSSPEDGFCVTGAWTKAGISTSILVRHRHFRRLCIAFDIGICPQDMAAADYVFISHGHTDHAGAIFSHARLRSLSKGVAKYVVPPDLVGPLADAKDAFERLNGAPIPMDIISVGSGCVVRPFATQHRVHSQGYCLVRVARRGLRPELRGLDGRELARRRLSGEAIELVEEVTEVAYSGDTEMAALLSVPCVWAARLLMLEVTYLDGPEDSARKWQHIHLNDIVACIGRLAPMQQVVICHISDRYRDAESILSLIAAALPPEVSARVGVALQLFGRPEAVTSLAAFAAGG